MEREDFLHHIYFVRMLRSFLIIFMVFSFLPFCSHKGEDILASNFSQHRQMAFLESSFTPSLIPKCCKMMQDKTHIDMGFLVREAHFKFQKETRLSLTFYGAGHCLPSLWRHYTPFRPPRREHAFI